MSTLGSSRVLRAYVHVPPSGGWYADVSLDATSLPALGFTALTIGDLVLVGRVVRAGFDDNPNGAQPRVIVEGGAGWGTLLAREGRYGAPGGVRLSTVLRDLAALAGEAYVAPPEALLPPAYEWPASTPDSPVRVDAVLAELVGRGAIPTWRVDPASGTTRFGAWPSSGPADGHGRVLERNFARGRRTVGLDTAVAAFLPGSTLEGAPVRRLFLVETAGALRAEVRES